ncbi:MAG: hypothetical protein K9N35_03800 [Candidatus Marinimicrobia bacterium]|nr:hypothetical protein [Candidatus Neomarinimicrobiota bacterium]
MKIRVKELTTIGPTIHSAFSALPFQRDEGSGSTLLKPVLAYQSPSCIKIVGNIHSFIQAQDRKQPTVPAYLIEDSESTLELLQLIIEYYHPMSLMDKALLTRAALDLGLPRSAFAESLLPLLELAPREKLIDQVLYLLDLPLQLQTFIVDKELSLKRALIFQRAEPHLDWVTRFIDNLKIGINMTAEIIQNIWELASLDDVDFKSKAVELGLWEMADTVYDDNRLAVMEIRQKINAARYPTLTKAGEDLADELASVELPAKVRVKWDPQFEEQGLNIAFHARNEDELDAVLEKLATNKFKNLFKKI